MSTTAPVLWIPVSADPTASFKLIVEAVDEAVSLYWGGQRILSAKGTDCPLEQPLQRNRRFEMVYHNNDGGPGCLAWSVVEAVNGASLKRHQVQNKHLEGAQVIYLPFGLRGTVDVGG